MLAGMQQSGDGGMFSHMTASMDPTPNAEEMEKEMERALYKKNVRLQHIHVKTFDLSLTDHANKYAKLMLKVFEGLQTQEFMILYHDRRFVETPKPRWIAHLEWAEFELDITPNEPLRPTGEQGRHDDTEEGT